VRRVVEEDAEFRDRVAAAADGLDLGRPSLIFLTRPEGWEGELGAMAAEAQAEAEERLGEHGEQEARRRLKAAEESARRLEDALARERERAIGTTEELRAERRARRSAEERAADARRRADSTRSELAAARRALDEATAELAQLRAAVSHRPDLEKLGRDIAEAADAAESLAERLRSSADKLGAPTAGPDEAGGAKVAVAPSAGPPQPRRGSRTSSQSSPPAPRTQASRRTTRGAPRRSAPLPPGILSDSPEAAEHLVRTKGTVLVVDGYNASFAWRPSLPVAEQRRRLLDALEELATRTKADVEVVFDGAEAAPPRSSGGPRRLVRARFSPPGVEADDIVVGLVEDLALYRPVVVASNDHAVQDGAERRGANVISVRQLMAVLHREV
jgi:predicted RNA-binding protein with PIN domain